MKTWYTVTKDELVKEIVPGVTTSNEVLMNQLNWYEYLRHIKDMIAFGMNIDYELSDEHIEDVLEDIFRQVYHIMKERWPEPEEIADYMKKDSVQGIKASLVNLAMSHTEESWDIFEKDVREKLKLEELESE